MLSEHMSSLVPFEKLTPRNRDVFDLMGRGMTTKQIASRLRISESAVERHKSTIRQKLGVFHRSDLIALHRSYDIRSHNHGTNIASPFASSDTAITEPQESKALATVQIRSSHSGAVLAFAGVAMLMATVAIARSRK